MDMELTRNSIIQNDSCSLLLVLLSHHNLFVVFTFPFVSLSITSGASGARILTHLTHELHRTGKKYAIGAACIGGGQGIAVLLEKC